MKCVADQVVLHEIGLRYQIKVILIDATIVQVKQYARAIQAKQNMVGLLAAPMMFQQCW